MELTIPNSVVYDFEGRATVQEVAKSIIAQDRLVREALAVLEEVFPDLTFEKPIVSIRAVSQDSPLRTTLEALVVAAYSPELGQDMPDILEVLFGSKVLGKYDSVVDVLVLLIAIWGVEWLYHKLVPGKNEPDLRKERDRLLEDASRQASVTEDHLEEAVEKVLQKRKRTVMKASADFLEPAKRHKASAVVSGTTAISKTAIDAMPSDIDLAQYEPATEIQTLQNVAVHFRAHDLDRNKAWAATIEDVSPLRRPLHLAPDVRPEQLFDKKDIRADVLVTYTLDPDGEYVPSLYYLQKVHNDNAAGSA
jgi:hypothetical protein